MDDRGLKAQLRHANALGLSRTIIIGEEEVRSGSVILNGCNVIAVGGLSLSRGLTLEGLTISYFLRNSVMYDTLMQMGRWFGITRLSRCTVTGPN
jgi:hypothetical protein